MAYVSRLLMFIKVAEHLSFSRAATDLGMSQSAVSKAISLMEDELGVRLLERTSRSVDLTRAGRAYLPHARNIVRLLTEAKAEVRQMSNR